jgi:hypothetical protein
LFGSRLPNLENASIDIRKLRDYVLNPNHQEGRHKARVFLSALGLAATDADWLANVILQNIAESEAVLTENTPWGQTYRVDFQVLRGSRCAVIRTGWLCSGEITKLTTCFIVGECNETA